MEKRIVRVQMIKSGNGEAARINLSVPFLREILEVNGENRKVLVSYDVEKENITIKKNRGDDFLRYDILEREIENVLNYDDVLALVEKESNNYNITKSFLFYNPVKALKLRNDVFLVFADMEDMEESFTFSTTAFLVVKEDGKLKMVDDFIRVFARKIYSKTEHFFAAIEQYKYFLKADPTLEEKEIHFVIKEFGDKEVDEKLEKIFNIYVDKIMGYIQKSMEEMEKAKESKKEFEISEIEFSKALQAYIEMLSK